MHSTTSTNNSTDLVSTFARHGQRWGIDVPARPDAIGTVLLLIGIIGTRSTMDPGAVSAYALARHAAIGIGISVGASLVIDFTRGARNMLRADALGMLAIYGLIFAEFLVPQKEFDSYARITSIRFALDGVFLGIAAFAIGRHCLLRPDFTRSEALLAPTSPSLLITLFWVSFSLGFLHQWLAVDFDPLAWLDEMMGARFSQPWSRGRLGDWKALIYELGLLIYVLPPLGAVIIARRKLYSGLTIAGVSAATALVFFYGFTTGTRNVFAVFVITFAIASGYYLRGRDRTKSIALSGTALLVIYLSINTMLEFRNIGFKAWLQGSESIHIDERDSLFVDFNLLNFSNVTEEFGTDTHPYLGVQVPYLALIRPIPRALWKGKPDGLTTTIEEALEVEEEGAAGVTISVTFIGEAYLAGGMLAIVAAGLALGAFSGWWNHLASPRFSDLGVLIYASGFFSASIAVRSLFTFTTAILPTVALFFFARWAVRRFRGHRGAAPALVRANP